MATLRTYITVHCIDNEIDFVLNETPMTEVEALGYCKWLIDELVDECPEFQNAVLTTSRTIVHYEELAIQQGPIYVKVNGTVCYLLIPISYRNVE
jgi:hypothetical protein